MCKVHGSDSVRSKQEFRCFAREQLVPSLLTLDRSEYPRDLTAQGDQKPGA